MKCEDLLRMLNDYVDGEIDPSICDQFEQHLEGCDPCQVVIDTTRRTITLYKDEQVYSVPLEFRQRLHQSLRERWNQSRSSSASAAVDADADADAGRRSVEIRSADQVSDEHRPSGESSSSTAD